MDLTGEAGLILATDFVRGAASMLDLSILDRTDSSLTDFECLKMLIMSPIGVIPILNGININIDTTVFILYVTDKSFYLFQMFFI